VTFLPRPREGLFSLRMRNIRRSSYGSVSIAEERLVYLLVGVVAVTFQPGLFVLFSLFLGLDRHSLLFLLNFLLPDQTRLFKLSVQFRDMGLDGSLLLLLLQTRKVQVRVVLRGGLFGAVVLYYKSLLGLFLLSCEEVFCIGDWMSAGGRRGRRPSSCVGESAGAEPSSKTTGFFFFFFIVGSKVRSSSWSVTFSIVSAIVVNVSMYDCYDSSTRRKIIKLRRVNKFVNTVCVSNKILE
jgi:hypothetical protein